MRKEQVVAWKAEISVDQDLRRQFMERAAKVLASFDLGARSAAPQSSKPTSEPPQFGARLTTP